jgi:hypothetical protein
MEATMPREFMPIMGYPDIRLPWALIAPHEAQARANHRQSLERLAQRGGLDPIEAYAVLTDRPWDAFNSSAGTLMRCRRALIELIEASAASGVAPSGGGEQ